MYFLINIIAILLGSILELIWLRRSRVKTRRALSLVAMLAACVFFFGLDIRLRRWPQVEVGFSAIRGIIGAGFALYIVQRFFEKQFRCFLEATIIALPLMYSISKFSCLLVGCCHGFEYSGAHAYVHEGKSYFPVQLIEIVCFLIITMVFIYIAKRKKNYLSALRPRGGKGVYPEGGCGYARNITELYFKNRKKDIERIENRNGKTAYLRIKSDFFDGIPRRMPLF